MKTYVKKAYLKILEKEKKNSEFLNRTYDNLKKGKHNEDEPIPKSPDEEAEQYPDGLC